MPGLLESTELKGVTNMKVIIAVDGTKHSIGVAEAAANLKLEAGSEIIVATVVDMGLPATIDIFSGHVPSMEEAEEKAREHAGKVTSSTVTFLEAALKDESVKVSARALFGSPDRRLVELAEDEGADLMIVGSHGYNRWEKLLLGSVSDSIVHHAPCSVMVVRPSGKE